MDSIVAECSCIIVFKGQDVNAKGESYIAEEHGMKNTPYYERWKGMKSRCFYNNSEYYRAKRIGICEQWARSFLSFHEFMGEKPFESASMDRINGNGHYCPHNVRWATKKQQVDNRTLIKNPRKDRSRWYIYVGDLPVRAFKTEQEAIDCKVEIRKESKRQRP